MFAFLGRAKEMGNEYISVHFFVKRQRNEPKKAFVRGCCPLHIPALPFRCSQKGRCEIHSHPLTDRTAWRCCCSSLPSSVSHNSDCPSPGAHRETGNPFLFALFTFSPQPQRYFRSSRSMKSSAAASLGSPNENTVSAGSSSSSAKISSADQS